MASSQTTAASAKVSVIWPFYIGQSLNFFERDFVFVPRFDQLLNGGNANLNCQQQDLKDCILVELAHASSPLPEG